MFNPSRLRSIIYAVIAGAGLAGAAYWLGTIRGAEQALAQYRNLSFQTTEDAMRRQLRFDTLLSKGQSDEARRGMAGAAWSHYSSLEDDAHGVFLPASEKMQESIASVRRFVADYCQSEAAAFHAAAKISVCRELALRGRQ